MPFTASGTLITGYREAGQVAPATAQRAAGQFYTLLGERPTQTYSFTQLVPDGERVRVDYTLGVTTEYPLREGVVLEPLPEIHGEFCRFRYSGKPVALNDHIIQIYAGVARNGAGPR